MNKKADKGERFKKASRLENLKREKHFSELSPEDRAAIRDGRFPMTWLSPTNMGKWRPVEETEALIKSLNQRVRKRVYAKLYPKKRGVKPQQHHKYEAFERIVSSPPKPRRGDLQNLAREFLRAWAAIDNQSPQSDWRIKKEAKEFLAAFRMWRKRDLIKRT